MADSICPKHDVKEPCWCCAQENQKGQSQPQQQESTSRPKSFSNPGK